MASSGIEIGLVLVLASMLWTGAVAQSGCTSVLIGMAPCLSYVTGSSSTPSSSCCSSLASVVQSQPQCLCTALNGGGKALGININQTLALALPGACNVQTPPVSQCDGASGPTSNLEGSPEISPVGSLDETPNLESSPEISPVGFSDETPNLEGSPEILPVESSDETPNSPTTSSVSGSKAVPSNGLTSDCNTIKMSFQLVAFFVLTASYASTFSNF